MFIQQLYTNCLAEAAYYIESEGEAVVIDPIRETEPYLELARERGARIRYIFETHFHADFVSGHIDLARKTGAEIVFGPGAEPSYDARIGHDGEVFRIGKITLELLHTPGHTVESSCFLLRDEQGVEKAVFTGDTLFIGDVGRPDLAVKSSLSREDLAGMLYESLKNKLMPLPDHVVVYPAHGAGSACGKNISKEKSSTIGEQKKMNYALNQKSKEDFISAVTKGLSAPPKYFFMDAAINKNGYESIDQVLEKGLKSLSVDELEEAMEEKRFTILDAREPAEFAGGHIPGSLNIGLNGQFAIWAASLLNPEVPVIIVAPEGKEQEAVLRLARVGFENVKGVLKDGMTAWKEAGKETSVTPCIDPVEFVNNHESVHVLDVRNEGEWNSGVIDNASLISLGKLEEQIDKLPSGEKVYVHCAGGYRSMIAASILEQHGIEAVNINGGMAKLREAGIVLAQPVA